jgi:hypothetical protein
MKIAFVATAALLAASAFAQSAVTSSSGASVSSGTGVTVTPGVPTATVTVTPSTSVAVPSRHLLPGGAMVQRSSTTVLGGPSGDVAGTRTEISTYWANVPADAPNRYDFQRWQSLR